MRVVIVVAIMSACVAGPSATTRIEPEPKPQPIWGVLWEVQTFTKLSELDVALPSWRLRIRHADSGLSLLARTLPCREASFDPIDWNYFCKILEVQVPLLRGSIERLTAEFATLESEIAKRKAEKVNAIDHDFQLRLYNFQNLLRRTDTVILVYWDSSQTE